MFLRAMKVLIQAGGKKEMRFTELFNIRGSANEREFNS